MSTESVSAPVALVTGADKGIGLETPGVWPGPGTACVSLPAAMNADGPSPRPPAQFLELDMTSDESVRHAADSVEQAGGTWTKGALPARNQGRPITSTGGGDQCDNRNTGS
jgi:NAD(P)-dependent dehydrogenase (short-subunit alcohol dehydrogenase family)